MVFLTFFENTLYECRKLLYNSLMKLPGGEELELHEMRTGDSGERRVLS